MRRSARSRQSSGRPVPPTQTARPACDRLAVTFAIDDPRVASAAIATALDDTSAPTGPVESVLREVAADPNASIRAVFPDEAIGVLGTNGLHLALANERTSSRKLSGIQLLRYAGAPTDASLHRVSAWRAALRSDPRVAYAEHPMIPYPVLDLTSRDRSRVLRGRIERASCEGEVRLDCHQQWGLRQCGFDCIWDELDVGVFPGSIGILDIGREPESPELAGRVVKYVTAARTPFGNSHPAAVAAIISAIRDGMPDETMLGCCSATLEVFSIYTEKGPDCQALYEMLKAVGRDRLRVVNMSFESPCEDPTVNRLIDQYTSDGTIFVAAMGNTGVTDNRSNWPAAHPAVIAVGATRNTRNDRWPHSCTGEHIFMTAPGVDILTVNVEDASQFHCEDGTSMAAPHVTAAVWLALRQRPHWGTKEIRCLLSQSVQSPNQPRNEEVGFGCLDVRRMAQLLRDRVCD